MAGWALALLLLAAYVVQPVEQARRGWHFAKRVKARVGALAFGGGAGSGASALAGMRPGPGGVAILADFESQGDLDVFVPVDDLQASLTSDHATHGSRAVLLVYPKRAQYPGLKWENPRADGMQDWSAYDRLKADFFNPGPAQAQLILKVKDGNGGQYNDRISFSPGEARTVEVPLGQLRAQGLDLSRISYVNFFVYQPGEEIRLILDYVRLEQAGAAYGAPAPAPAAAAPAPTVPIAAAPAPPAPGPRPASAPAGTRVLADFEDPGDLDVFAPVEGLAASLTAEHVTHGARAVLLAYPRGAQYPGLKWENPRADGMQNWSAYDRLKADFFNPGAGQVELVIKLKSGGGGQYTQGVILAPGEARTVEVSLGRVRAQGVDLSRISYVNFFVFQPAQELRLILDYLRLEGAGAAEAAPPPPSAPAPRAAAPAPPAPGPRPASAPPPPAPPPPAAMRVASEAPPPAPAGTRVLADFESEAELQRFITLDGLTATLVTQGATHGSKAVLLSFPPGKEFPNLRWQAGAAAPLQDWSGYDNLKVDISNPGAGQAQIQIKLMSGRARTGSFTQSVILAPGERRTIAVKLAHARGQGVNLAEISHLEFFMFRPAEETRLILDHIRLEPLPQVVAGAGQPAGPPGGNADYRLGVASSLRKIFNDEVAAAQQLPGVAAIAAAGREYEAFQIVITPTTKDLENVRVELEDLVDGKTGRRLDHGNLTWRLVGYVQTKKPYYQVERVGWWPDPLVPVKAFTAKRGAVTPVWITAYVPPGTPAGTYSGRVTVVPGNAPRAGVDLRLRVWGFDLPVTGRLKTAFNFYPVRMQQWHPRRPDESYEAWQRRMVQFEQDYYLAMLRHRISPVVYADPLAGDFDRMIDPLLHHGLTAFAIGPYGAAHEGWPRGPEAEANLVQRYRSAAQALRQKGLLDKAYIYTWDEPRVGTPDVPHVAALVHRADPHLKNLVTFYEPFQPAQDPAWTKDVDIWVPRINRYETPLYQPLQKAGKEVWLYVAGVTEPFPTLVLDFPAMAYRIIPWMLWKNQITGFLYWCVNFWRVNPWRDTMTYPDQNGNGSLFYPGEEGPVDTIRLEVLRDGIEDYEYFALLNALVSSLPGNGRCGDPAGLRREAAGILAVGPEIVRNLGEYTDDPRVLVARREKLGETIEHLAQCTGMRGAAASGPKG